MFSFTTSLKNKFYLLTIVTEFTKFLRLISIHFVLFTVFFNQFFFCFSSSYALASELPITPDATTNTQVTKTASGIDQVNIAAPNSAGLSHNKFTDYNVNKSGQVINNFSGKVGSEVVAGSGSSAVTSTQIGGLVVVNQNLTNSGSAKVILNEVTSTNNSKLLGYTEIAGTKANLIIANPNGITCSGCGFINTSRLSLIAGKSEFDANGNLKFGLSAAKTDANNLVIPLITIEGLGLDVEKTSSTDIISSSTKLISTIYADSELSIKSGDKYDYATNQVSSDDNSLNASPELFALDASNLGNIQAGRIFIVATKAGFGVNLGGNVVASKDLNVDAKGNIYYKNLSANGDVILKSTKNIADLNQSSVLSSRSGNVNVRAQNNITNNGIILAKNDVMLTSVAGDVDNLGNIATNFKIDISAQFGKLNNQGLLGFLSLQNEDGSVEDIWAKNLTLNTKILANSSFVNGYDVEVNSENLENSGQIYASQNLTINNSDSVTNKGQILAEGLLKVSAQDLLNLNVADENGEVSYALIKSLNSDLELNISNKINNEGILAASDSQNYKGNLKISALNILQNEGQIFFSNSASLNSKTIINSGLLGSDQNFNLYSDSLTNSGTIFANQDLVIDDLQEIWDSGLISDSESQIDNYGSIQAVGKVSILADSLDNNNLIYAGSDLDLKVRELKNEDTIFAGSDFGFVGESFDNKALVNAGESAEFDVVDFNNEESLVIVKTLTLKTFDDFTNSGLISANDSKINYNNSQKTFINAGFIESKNDLEINSDLSIQNLGTILANGNSVLNTKVFSNQGNIASKNSLIINSDLSLDNSGSIGYLQLFDADENAFDVLVKNVILNSKFVKNSSFVNGYDVEVNSENLENSGQIYASQNLTINNSDSVTNKGQILAEGLLKVSAQDLLNLNVADENGEVSYALIKSLNSDLELNISNKINNEGILAASDSQNYKGNLKISALNILQNEGQIFFSNSASLNSKTIINSGLLGSDQNFNLYSDSLTNSGTIFANQDFALQKSTQALEVNNSGAIQASEVIAINSDNFENSGFVKSGSDLEIVATKFDNKYEISAESDLNISIISDFANYGNISSGADLAIFSAKNNEIAANNFSNSGKIQSYNNLEISSDNNFENSGAILANKGVNLAAKNSFTNLEDGYIFASLDLDGDVENSDLKIDSVIFTNNGEIQSNSDVFLTSNKITNNNQIYTAGNLEIAAENPTNSDNYFKNNGLIQSELEAKITINNIANFSLLSAENLNLGSNKIVNYGQIQATNSLIINLSGNLENYGNLVGAGDIFIKAENLLNAQQANINSVANLDLEATQMFDNWGNIHADNLNLKANSLINNANSLIASDANLTLKIADEFENLGDFYAANNLSITSYLENEESFVPETGNQLKIYNYGQILSDAEIKIMVQEISNYDNLLSNQNLNLAALNEIYNYALISSEQELKLSANNLVNYGANSSVNAKDNLEIAITNDFYNQGLVQSDADIKINAGNIYNNYEQALIFASQNLQITAVSLDNSKSVVSQNNVTNSGILAKNGDVKLVVDAVNNNLGVIKGKNVSATTNNNQAINLSNLQGSFLASSSVDLDLGSANYTITGTIYGADYVDIKANNITNLGNVQTTGYIKLDAADSILNGYRDYNNSLNQNVLLAAGSYLEIIAKNNIDNFGAISAVTTLSLTSTQGDINNETDKIIGGNGVVTISALNGAFNNKAQTNLSGSVVKSGLVTANDSLVINVRDLNNFGEISVANDLETNVTNNLTNNKAALIWSGGDTTLNVVNNLLNNSATIYTVGDLAIQKNASQDSSLNKTALVQNISGEIITQEGDMMIKAESLENKRSSMKTQSYIYWKSGCNFHHYECHYDSSYKASFSGTAGADSNILSGNDLHFEITNLTNDTTSILSKQNMFVNAVNVNNTSRYFESYVNYKRDWWGSGENKKWLLTYKPDNRTIESYLAYIKAGGSISGNISNQINNTTIVQNSSVNNQNSLRRSTTNDATNFVQLIETGTIEIDLASIIGNLFVQLQNQPSTQNVELSNSVDKVAKTNIDKNTVANVGASGFANNASSTISTTNSAIALDNLDLLNIAAANKNKAAYRLSANNYEVKANNPNLVEEVALSSNQSSAVNNSRPKISLPKEIVTIASESKAKESGTTIYSGLFKINKNQNSNKPLIESRSQFTNTSEFYGSSYYFSQLGLNGDAFVAQLNQVINQTANQHLRMLGDSFTESKLILNQIQDLRNDALYLSDDGVDGQSEIKDLLDNSVSELSRLGISAADVALNGLTQSQINSLDKDIVTFEKIEVGGISVLAPKIYLSLATRNKLAGNASSTSVPTLSDVNLTNSSLVTDSTIFAKGDLLITSSDSIFGSTSSLNSSLNSKASLINSGSIISGGNMIIDVTNLRTQTNSAINSSSLISQTPSSLAKIKSGGDLLISTTGDIDANNSKIISGNDLILVSGNNINLRNSALDSGNKITINAVKDVTISNSLDNYKQTTAAFKFSLLSLQSSSSSSLLRGALATKQSTSTQTNSNLNNGSPHFASLLVRDDGGQDLSSVATISTSSFTSSTSSTIKDDAISARNSAVFNAGSDIEISSSGNINIANNYFNTGGSIYMNSSAGNINNSNYTISASNNVVMSAVNVNNISTATTVSQAITNPTEIIAGNMVSIDAFKDSSGNGGNINNIGATISGDNLVYLTAEGEVNNEATINYKINNKSTNSDGTAITQEQVLASNADRITSTLISQGNITSSNGNVVIVAQGDINNTGSKITAGTELSTGDTSGGHIYLESTKGDVNISTAQLRDRSKATTYGKKNTSITRISDKTTNLQSEITASTGTIEINAGTDSSITNDSETGNINITGSKLTSAEDLTLTAKNDVNITSAQDTIFNQSNGRIGKGKSFLNKSSSTTQIGSELATTNNGNINITSGQDNTSDPSGSSSKGSINLIASKLVTSDTDSDVSNNTSNGDITLTARKDINIMSDLNTNYEEKYSSKKSSTVKKTSTDIAENKNNVSSEITSNNDVNITSGGDTNIIASNLSGNGSANITAGKYLDTDTSSATYNTEIFNENADVNVLSAIDSEYKYHNATKTKLSFNVQQAVVGALIGGIFFGIAAGIKKDKQSTESSVYKETVVSSNLNFGSDVNITSMNDLTIKSSNVEVEDGNINLVAASEVKILAEQEKKGAYQYGSTNGLYGSNKKQKFDNEQVTNISSNIKAGSIGDDSDVKGNINIMSGDDMTLQIAKITADNDVILDVGNNLKILAAVDSSSVSYSNNDETTFNFTNGSSGNFKTKVINTEIITNNNGDTIISAPTINVAGVILAQYNSKDYQEQNSSSVSGSSLAYLSQLDSSKTIYNPIEEVYQ